MRFATSRHDPHPLAMLSLASLVLILLPGSEANAILCGLALAATFAAMREHRPCAMLAAVGIAIGLSPAGVLMAPLALGSAIRRRSTRWLPIAATTAIVSWRLTGCWTTATTLPALADVTIARPDLGALVGAGAIGVAAWIAADASSRFLSPRAALASGLALALFVPTPFAVLLLPLAFAWTTIRATTQPRPAANDDPMLARKSPPRPMSRRSMRQPLTSRSPTISIRIEKRLALLDARWFVTR